MGIIPDFDSEFEEVKVGEGGEYKPLEAGIYEGVVQSAEIRESRKPWVDAELSLKIQVDSDDQKGKITFADIEVAPLTQKDKETGQLVPSKGKLKFLKWQLNSLGYDGKLSDLEYNTHGLVGARVEFEQKVVESSRINTNTGKPFIDREVVLRENLLPGVGVGQSAPDTTATQVY